MLVECDAKTCIHYKNGICQSEALKMKNFTWYSEKEKEEKNKTACVTYEYDRNWMYKRI